LKILNFFVFQDARETAPAASKVDMFHGNPDSSTKGLKNRFVIVFVIVYVIVIVIVIVIVFFAVFVVVMMRVKG
jgi:hypothetical protein